jgi:beta-lactamase class A
MIFLVFWLATAAAPPPALDAEIEQIAHSVEGRVGAAMMLLETGETAGFDADGRFPMQSVYKFPIAMAILSQVDAGALKLDGQVRVAKADLVPPSLHSPIRDQHPEGVELSVRELLRFNIVESDGTASDVLLRLAGGPERVTQYLRGLGIDGVAVATSEMEMSRGQKVQYRNWATPRSMLELLRVFHRGAALSPAGRDLLLRLMQESVPGGQRIKGLLPPGTMVAHKTGTSGTVNGMTAATNDVGIVTLPGGRHMAVVVFVSDSKGTLQAREGVIARIARAGYTYWAR